ncbi:MAG: hypothetical protein EP341_03760 [Sphingomonadales bacterium]|nr:MAG: hypothetical protein EP341_03760 [Sphingomonadales bacterium]
MLAEDRRLRDGESPTLAILLTWVCVSIVLLAVAASRIIDNQYPGPDDALRLVQVRDLLAGQGWYDLHQYRMMPPDGTLMHWSRLVDIPIAGLILFFSLFLEQDMAERVTMVVIPLVTLLLTMLVIGRLTWRLFDRQAAIYACVSLVLLPMLAMQFQPLRIDHHGWQILSVVFALWAITWRNPASGGAAAGFAMATGLMISLETIFMSAAFASVLAIRWLRDNHQRWWLVSYLQSLALGLVLLFAATRGLPDLAAHCDAISPPQIGFFLIVALGSGALAVAPSIPRLPLVAALAGFGVLGIFFIGWSAPQCLVPPFADLDPLVRDYWYANVTEGQPVWKKDFDMAIPAIIQPLIALGFAVYLFSTSHDWVRWWWSEYAIVLIVALLGGVLTARSIAFAGAVAAIPMGWFVARLFVRWRAHTSLLRKAMLAIVLYLVFIPAAPLLIWQQIQPQRVSSMAPSVGMSKCELRTSAKLLNQLPPATLFSPLDIGPALLFHTHHSVVASGHHRAEQAMHDVIGGFIGDADQARDVVKQYGADYVVICVDLIEATNLRFGGDEAGLMGRLVANDPPAWLEQVDLGTPEAFLVWRVVDEPSQPMDEGAEATPLQDGSSSPGR